MNKEDDDIEYEILTDSTEEDECGSGCSECQLEKLSIGDLTSDDESSEDDVFSEERQKKREAALSKFTKMRTERYEHYKKLWNEPRDIVTKDMTYGEAFLALKEAALDTFKAERTETSFFNEDAWHNQLE